VNPRPRLTPAVGDVAAIPLPGGGYGACQLVGEATACALNWYSDTLPTLAQLADAGPLALDHHAHPGEVACVHLIDAPAPPNWVWLGQLPPVAPAEAPASSGWRWFPSEIVAQRRWDRDLPSAAKHAFRAAATRGLIEVDYGRGPVTVGAATGQVTLDAADGPVDWSFLDRLTRCTTVRWTGPDTGLTAALAAHPIVSTLFWTGAPPSLDLSGTGLVNLTLAGTVDSVRLPATLSQLDLSPGARVSTVSAAGKGRWIRLITGAPAVPAGQKIPAGLEQVRDLTVIGPGTIDAAPLAHLSHLESLALAWKEPPGVLTNADALAALPLAQLTLVGAYGLDSLPDLPGLTALTVHGVPRRAVAPIRARYGHIRLSITGVRRPASAPRRTA